MAIHPTAVINPKAQLHDSVEVGPYCVIDADVRVAAGCRLYQGVYLTGWTEIGEGCELHPGVIVGHAPQDIKYGGERTYCRVGRGTILREYVTVHRGTVPESETVVGENCFVLAGAHVAHNCRIGNDVTIINSVLLGGHVQVDDRVTIGGAAGVHQFVRIGTLAMIPGNARVVQDVLPYALVDAQGRVAGLNRVGLRRAGMSREHVQDVRDAYRLLFARGLRISEAIERLAGEPPTPPRRVLTAFLQAQSRRGLAGRVRRRAATHQPPAE
jgi:UDP-N-acetylglucosamine acyltransferase